MAECASLAIRIWPRLMCSVDKSVTTTRWGYNIGFWDLEIHAVDGIKYQVGLSWTCKKYRGSICGTILVSFAYIELYNHRTVDTNTNVFRLISSA